MLVENLMRYLRIKQYGLQKCQADRVSCFYKTFHNYYYLTETLIFQVLKDKSVFACTTCVNQLINTKDKNIPLF